MSTNTTDQSQATSKSTQTFITALILNAAIAGGEFAAFLLIRKYFPRIYQPRSELPPEGKRTRPLPRNLLSIIPAVILANDEDIIAANGLDAYLFVRFLKLMMWIFAPVACLTWIILLPIYGTGGGTNTGLNQFTFGNIGGGSQARYGATLVLCYVNTFFIMYLVYREYGRFVEKRQDFLTSKGWSTRPQSRTVLLTGIPDDYCNIEALQDLTSHLPGGVRKIWLARDLKTLSDVYDRRAKATKKLESAYVKVIKQAAKLVRKKKVPEEGNADQEKNGSVVSRYIADKKRPTTRLGKLPLVGKKVDTIEWANDEIASTNEQLAEARRDLSRYPPKSSAFILFNDQIAAHMFAQCLAHELPLRMSGRYINVSPDDVIWSTLNINPFSKRLRFIASWAATAAVIIFWSIPTAFVTSISNVSHLCATVSWLRWLCDLPVPVNGIIQGILPPVALMVLFMLLPPFFRFLSVFQGTPLRSLVEHDLQRRYFAFLFVQGFIIATLASGIMAGISQITDNPSSAVSLLADNLPSASIFFLTLMVTNGLSGAAGGVLQVAKLVIYYVKIVLLGGTPRAMYKIRYTMPSTVFGTTFPAQMLLVVIALAYATIAPLVCGFALLTFALWWFCWKYLFLWVYDQPAAGETGGLFFKTALKQMFAGMYIEQLCLIGLFFLARDDAGKISALPEAILMIVLLIITILFNLTLESGYGPLARYLPLSMAGEMSRNEDQYARELAAESAEKKRQNGASASGAKFGSAPQGGATTQGENGLSADAAPRYAEARKTGANGEQIPLDQRSSGETPDAQQGAQGEDEEYDELAGGLNEHAFHHPALFKDAPTVWIPRDSFGISKEAVTNSRSRGVDVTDEDAAINGKGKIEISRDTVPGTDYDK